MTGPRDVRAGNGGVSSKTLMAILAVVSLMGLTIVTGTSQASVEVSPSGQMISNGASSWQVAMTMGPQDQVHLFYNNDSGALYYANDTLGSVVAHLLGGGEHLGSECSIAVDSRNIVHLSWVDDDGHDLRYATNSNGAWSFRTIDGEGVEGSTRMAVDSRDRVHMCYLADGLRYATGTGGSWDLMSIDIDCVAIHAMVLDGGDRVLILYSDEHDYKHAQYDGGSWTIRTIGSRTFVQGGAVTIDGDDHLHLGLVVDGDLLYANDSTGSWRTQVVASSVHPDDCHIALDAQGCAHITYTDVGRSVLRYATNLDGAWSIHTIDENESEGSIHGGPLVVDSGRRVHIAYPKSYPELGSDPSVVRYVTFTPIVLSTPEPPTGLTAIPSGDQVRLNWSAPALDGGSDITGYRLYWSVDREWTYSSVLVNDTSYLHTGLGNGTTVSYMVAAINQEGEGMASGTVTIVVGGVPPVPSAPTALTGTYTEGGVSLQWTAPDHGVGITGYRIYRGTDVGSLGMLALASGPTFLDTSVTAGQTYHYVVRAVNDSGEGAGSAMVSVTVPTSHGGGAEPSLLDSFEVQAVITGLVVAGVGTAGYLLWRSRRT